MARTFLTLTQDQIDIRTAQSIQSREQELLSYDYEADSHQAAITALGNIQWDDTNSKYKGMSRDQMIAAATADGLDSDAIQSISNLLALDYHQHNLEAVNIETAKSERAYDYLLTTLPAGPRRDAAMASLQTPTDQ